MIGLSKRLRKAAAEIDCNDFGQIKNALVVLETESRVFTIDMSDEQDGMRNIGLLTVARHQLIGGDD